MVVGGWGMKIKKEQGGSYHRPILPENAYKFVALGTSEVWWARWKWKTVSFIESLTKEQWEIWSSLSCLQSWVTCPSSPWKNPIYSLNLKWKKFGPWESEAQGRFGQQPSTENKRLSDNWPAFNSEPLVSFPCLSPKPWKSTLYNIFKQEIEVSSLGKLTTSTYNHCPLVAP